MMKRLRTQSAEDLGWSPEPWAPTVLPWSPMAWATVLASLKPSQETEVMA